MQKYKYMMITAMLGISLTGCEFSKDRVLDRYDNALQFFSKTALTKELQGTKEQGEDPYTGSYSADYQNYSGTEYIFGATALNREKGNTLCITYTLAIESGEAQISFDHSGSIYTLSDESGSGAIELTLTSGDNYISLTGRNFTGSLSLKSE